MTGSGALTEADTSGPGAAAFLAALVQSSDNAIVGKSLDGTILSWNDSAQRIFGWSAAEIVGRNIRTLIPLDRQAEEDAIIASISSGERVPPFETVRLRKDGSEVLVDVTVSPVLDAAGKVVAASKIARDITAQKQVMKQLAESEERLRLLADNMSQLAWIAEPRGSIIWFNRRWFDYTGAALQDMRNWQWRSYHHPDHLHRVVRHFSHCIDTGQDWEDTFPLRGADGSYRWFLSRAKAIRDSGGRIVRWFGTNTDVTEMRDAEQRIALLLDEVNHRSKNMLAVILSIARRTDSGHPDFVKRLEQRIRGLAANQDLLVSRSWSDVPLIDMIEAQLGDIGDVRKQVRMAGPPVSLSPAAAESLAMAMHEMTTNSLKYGALSVVGGWVDIVWSLTQADGQRFELAWRESGGPPVSVPARTGFGTRITIDVPRSRLNAVVETHYPPEGFVWTLACDPADLG